MVKKLVLSLLLVLNLNNCFSQRYGVDGGWFYNKAFSWVIEDHFSPGNPLFYGDFKQRSYLFPNVSLRPFIRLYDKYYLYFGADLLRYELTYWDYLHSYSTSGNKKAFYNIKYREIHVPLMIKYRLQNENENNKFITCVYAGLFYRTLFEKRFDHVLLNDMNEQLYHAQGNSNIRIEETRNAFLNFIIGAKENFKPYKNILPYISCDFKYYTGHVVAYAPSAAVSTRLALKTHVSLQLTIGMSLRTGSKVKQSGNPLKFE